MINVIASILIAVASLIPVVSIQAASRLNVIVLFDISSSRSEQDLRMSVNALHETLNALGTKDRIQVFPIDAASETRSQRLFSEDFRNSSFALKSDGFANAGKKAKEHMKKHLDSRWLEIEKSISGMYRNGRTAHTAEQTDILGALKLAATQTENTNTSLWQSLTGYRTHNVVLLFSDMVNETPQADFKKSFQVQPSIQRLLACKDIPGLSGCTVIVCGATTDSKIQYDKIRSFWQQYFGLSKAALRAYGYDTAEDIKQEFLRMQ